MPPWLMKPCCMLTPSTDASSPDCRPPLTRASNALLPAPVLTPGMSSANVAAARGPVSKSSGSWLSVSGAMPCSWVAVVPSTDEPPITSTLSATPPALRLTSTRSCWPSVTSTSGSEHGAEAVLGGLHLVRRRRQVAERIVALRVRDGRAHHLVAGDVAQGHGDVGNDGAARVLDDADDGAVDGLGRRAPKRRQEGSDENEHELPVGGFCASALLLDR